MGGWRGGAGHLTSLSIDANSFQAAHFEVPVSDLDQFPVIGMQLTVIPSSGILTLHFVPVSQRSLRSPR